MTHQDIIQDLINKFNIVALKSSFEDEGSELIYQTLLTKMCAANGFKTLIKIGGAEARTDVLNCKRMGTDIIVAPMIESGFACKKFLSLVKDVYSDEVESHSFFINIETVTALENLPHIFANDINTLSGVVVGRSDLCASMGLGKHRTDSAAVLDRTVRILRQAKQHQYTTNMGGNITVHSRDFVGYLHEQGLLDRIETRLVVVEVDENLLGDFDTFIDLALSLEKHMLQMSLEHHAFYCQHMIDRIEDLGQRT